MPPFLYLFRFTRTIIVFAVDLLEFHELEFEKNEAAAEEAVRPDTITKYTLLDAKIDASVTITLLFKLELSSGAEKLALFQNDGTVNPKTSEYHASCFSTLLLLYSEGHLDEFESFFLLDDPTAVLPLLSLIFTPAYISTYIYLYGDGIIRIER